MRDVRAVIMSPGPLTFTAFAAQVGPGIEHEAVRWRDSRRRARLQTVRWIDEKGLRLVAMICGVGTVLYAATRGLDGSLIATGSLLIGYAIGKKT